MLPTFLLSPPPTLLTVGIRQFVRVVLRRAKSTDEASTGRICVLCDQSFGGDNVDCEGEGNGEDAEPQDCDGGGNEDDTPSNCVEVESVIGTLVCGEKLEGSSRHTRRIRGHASTEGDACAPAGVTGSQSQTRCCFHAVGSLGSWPFTRFQTAKEPSLVPATTSSAMLHKPADVQVPMLHMARIV